MFFSQPFRQERVPNGTRKRNVYDPAIMHMSDFSISEAKFACAKPMWVDGDLGPRGNDVFEILQLLHKFASASVGCTSTFARFMPPPILPSKNFLEIVDELNVNIEFVSAREAIDTSGPMGRMFLTMVGSIAELKRSLIVERIKDGMRRAKWGGSG